MDNLNNIPNAGNWGDAASKLNDNFNKIKQSLTTVENTSKNNKGYFTSLSALNTASPSPKAGLTAYVYNEASSTKYYIYNAVNGAWVATSIEAPSVGVDIAGYTKTGGSTKTTKQVEDELDQLDVKKISIDEIQYNKENSILSLSESIWENGYWTQTDPVASANHIRTKNFHQIEPDKNYIFGGNPSYTGYITLRLYDINGQFLRTITKTSGNTGAPKFKTSIDEVQFKMYISDNPASPITPSFARDKWIYLSADDMAPILTELEGKADLDGSITTMKQVDDNITLIQDKINDIVNGITIDELEPSTAMLDASISIDSDGNPVYVAATNQSILLYGKYGFNAISIPSECNHSNYKLGVSTYIIGNVMHVVLTGYDLTSATNGLNYITVDLTNYTVTYIGKITNGSNTVMRLSNIIEHNGSLYIASWNTAEIVDGVIDNTLGAYKVQLFKLIEETWSLQSTISEIGEVWGESYENNYGTQYMVFDEPIKLGYPSLSSDGNKIHCVLSLMSTTTDKYRIFFKSSDNLIDWNKDSISSHYRGFINSGYFNSRGEMRILIKRFLSQYYTTSSTRLQIVDGSNSYRFPLDRLDIYDFEAIYNNGVIYVSAVANRVVGQSTKMWRIAIKESLIEKSFSPSPTRNIGRANISTIPPTNIDVGDYYIAEDVGTYQFIEAQLPWKDSFETIYTKVRKGERKYIIWGGVYWHSIPIYDRNVSPLKSNIIHNGAPFNPYRSNRFRSPIVVEAIDGTLVCTYSIMYTHGGDDDQIDVGVQRSSNGIDWKDRKIIFDHLVSGHRVHDCSLVVDNHKDSPQYGRIWAFAKRWNSNYSNSQTEYWSLNIDKMEFLVAYSDDNGLNWSTPVALPFYTPGVRHVSPGVTTGITMNDGTLIMPIYRSYLDSEIGTRSQFIYKPVGGEWTLGDMVPLAAGGWKSNECQIIQDIDGSLYLNARSDQSYKRLIFKLTSIGDGWVEMPAMEVFTQITGTAGSFVRYKNTYLFSHPMAGLRKRLTVHYSYDMIKWDVLVEITPYEQDTAGGILGYSSLLCTDSNFGIAFEDERFNMTYVDLSCYRNILR